MIFPFVLGFSFLAVVSGGVFPQIDLEAEKNQQESHGPGSEVLQIIDAPDRRSCPPGMKYIEGRCRKVFIVNPKKNKTVSDTLAVGSSSLNVTSPPKKQNSRTDAFRYFRTGAKAPAGAHSRVPAPQNIDEAPKT